MTRSSSSTLWLLLFLFASLVASKSASGSYLRQNGDDVQHEGRDDGGENDGSGFHSEVGAVKSRKLRAKDGEVFNLDDRVKQTLMNRGLMKVGDKVNVEWDNVNIHVGRIQRGKNTNRNRGIQQRGSRVTTRRNRNPGGSIRFSVFGKDDFTRTFSSLIKRGLRWSKNDIEASTWFTPESKSKTRVTFPLDRLAPYAKQNKVSVPYSFSGFGVRPRTEAKPTVYFQTRENGTPFTAKLTIRANGKVRTRVTSNRGKTTTVVLSLREALGPKRDAGFSEGRNDSEVIFNARGRLFWTDTTEALMNVQEFSLDARTENIPYKSVTVTDTVEI